MVRQSVVVEGVTFTRVQVEKALQELNMPPEAPEVGTRLRYSKKGGAGYELIVVGGIARDVLLKRWGSLGPGEFIGCVLTKGAWGDTRGELFRFNVNEVEVIG